MSNYAKYKDLGEKSESFSADPKGLQQHNKIQRPLEPKTGSTEPTYKEIPQSIIEIENLDHKNHLISNFNVFVVKVYANWCQPCKQIKPRCNQIASKYLSQVPRGMFGFAQENADLKLSNVKGVPTFQFFKNGKYINEDLVGADVTAVDNMIAKLLQ